MNILLEISLIIIVSKSIFSFLKNVFSQDNFLNNNNDVNHVHEQLIATQLKTLPKPFYGIEKY